MTASIKDNEPLIYRISAATVKNEVLHDHLHMSGTNPQGVEIKANSRYLTVNGKPVLFTMGEFHFSRYPRAYWEESLLKMKAANIRIVASYIFWIHHEGIEGSYSWTGNHDVRRFAELCGKHGLFFYPRIGPWSHGECRNGGFPDWIYGKCEVRTNDPAYLRYARQFYGQIYSQLTGLLYKDGGPVVGVQIENEFYGDMEHIRTLKRMAVETGFDVPIYTATGWGDAAIPLDELIPVFGGYPEAPWTQHTGELEPSVNYFFRHVRNDSNIGNDLFEPGLESMGKDDPNIERYPYFTCEMGGGNQVTYHRRPVITPEDVASLSLLQLGNGCTLLGYYMFHGGTHPIGQLTTMNESKETGYPNDYPVLSYDFQAPIGEFGTIKPSYHALKRLTLFAAEFGDLLAPMISVLPEQYPGSFDDSDTLKYAIRTLDNSGFLFINNYVRRSAMKRLENLRFEIELEQETLRFPQKPMTVPKGAYFLLPFNLRLAGGIVLKYATVQPICKLEYEGVTSYFLFAPEGIDPEFAFDAGTVQSINALGAQVNTECGTVCMTGLQPDPYVPIRVRGAQGTTIQLITLTEQQSLRLWKGEAWGQQRIVVSPANILFEQDRLQLFATDEEKLSFSVFPPAEHDLKADGELLQAERDGIFSLFTIAAAKKEIEVRTRLASVFRQANETSQWSVAIPKGSMDGVNDLFLCIRYVGDAASLFLNGQRIADHFYDGTEWVIGLKRFMPDILEGELVLHISPLSKDADIYMEPRPDLTDVLTAELEQVSIMPEYRYTIQS
ncbi:beta-galactosidase [Paenibacillus sp. MBLB4367]|uniref:beta-galactosidase n=1 Tax=Paenibacillus sp. MBLB4367 TaxID=3384767 RepID=UPI0039080442